MTNAQGYHKKLKTDTMHKCLAHCLAQNKRESSWDAVILHNHLAFFILKWLPPTSKWRKRRIYPRIGESASPPSRRQVEGAPGYSEPSLPPRFHFSPVSTFFGLSLRKMLRIPVWETHSNWSMKPGDTRRRKEPETLPVCSHIGLQTISNGGIRMEFKCKGFSSPWSTSTQKEAGSELAAFAFICHYVLHTWKF